MPENIAKHEGDTQHNHSSLYEIKHKCVKYVCPVVDSLAKVKLLYNFNLIKLYLHSFSGYLQVFVCELVPLLPHCSS